MQANPRVLTTVIGLTLALPGIAQAGSFAVNENSANDLGRANAGRAVSTQDAIAAFGNPAMMTAQERAVVTSTLSYIIGDATFTDEGSTDPLGAPLSGVSTTDAFPDSFVPSLQAVVPVSDRVALGLSVNAPFGLASEFEDARSITRYQAINSELFTLNVNPSVAVALNDRISVGAGLNAQYADVRLTSAVDFGSIALARQMGGTPDPRLPGSDDGGLDLRGEDWSFGWNAGIALHPSERLTLGAHYRSEIDHVLEGPAFFTPGPQFADAVTANGAFQDTEARAELDLPSTVEIGARWSATDSLTLYADWTRQDWRDFKELRIAFDNPAQPDSVEEFEYGRADRLALGTDVRVSPRWTLRGGVARDETPVNPEFPSARIPDNDRTFYALGATLAEVELLGPLQLDLAYTLIDVADTEFERRDAFGNTLRGTGRSRVHIVAAGVTKRF